MQDGTEVLPVAREKTRAVFLAYEAEGYLRSGDVDQAADAALTALEVAERIGAPRCTALIHELAPDFERHPMAPGVEQLLGKIHSVTHG